jgi:ABC-type phosphate transport system substrate-binding protein
LAIGAAVLLAAAVMLRSPSVWSDDFVVIRNAKNPTTSITPAQAKEMAIGKRKAWPHGAVVGMALTPVGSPELGWFASQVCGVADGALMAKIKQEVFKGELRKPTVVNSSSEVMAAVAADEGAFGIVNADALKANPPGVAVLAIK